MRNDLTQARLLEVYTYEPTTGEFHRVASGGGRKAGSLAGSASRDGYNRIMVDGYLYLAHRLAWIAVTGEWPADEIDHINGVRSDNRLSNLRDVPHQVNSQNKRRANSNGQTRLLGVSQDKRRKACWGARIKLNGQLIHLGNFASPELAHAAYSEAKRQLHEGCTL